MSEKLIVIESGTDGSGKATQTEKLYNRLINEGLAVKHIEFPNYKSDSSALVKMYLRGDFGDKATDIDPYIASTFYAADRYASYQTEWKLDYQNAICISDRYTTSNMIHQSSKMEKESRDKYLNWLDDLEFNIYKIPRPDCVIFLNVPLEVSTELIRDRKNKFTNEDKKDIHESDYEYLKKTYENSLEIAKKYNWSIVECVRDGQMRSVNEIHEEIYKLIKKELNI